MALRATATGTGDGRHLFGREPAMRLVREFADRPGHASRPQPVLLFTGPRGSGKTAFLDALADRLHGQGPYARLDCEVLDPARLSLAHIAVELDRHAPDPIAFPRFVAGQVVAAQQLDVDPGIARLEAERALVEHRRADRLRALLGGLLPHAEHVGRRLADGVLRGLVSLRHGHRAVLAADWFGHQDRDLGRDPLDVLVELNRRARTPQNQDDARDTGELLWAALLADLREEFDRGTRRARRGLNCALLLDDVDSPAAKPLLDALVRARRQYAAHLPGGCDPLTVVATSRGKRSGAVIATGEASPLRDIERIEASGPEPYYTDFTEHGGKPWYPVRLRDLTRDEIGNMVDELGRYAGNRKNRVGAAILRLTGGHPGATRRLLEEIRVRPGDPVDLGPLLGDAPLLGPGGSFGLAEPFRAGLAEEALHDLVTCAAARHQVEAERLVAHSGLAASHGARAVFAPELWVPADDGHHVLPPVLRRVLLRELAARPEQEPANWTAVHTWFRETLADQGDEVGELYHSLAVGEVESVARRLNTLLAYSDLPTWLDLLAAATAAPNRLDHADPQLDQVRSLADWTHPGAAPQAAVARLVAARWIAADPLGDSRRHALYLEIAACYDEIAPHSGSGLATLRAESEKYRRWSELTD
ncbi:ATP-binding protein [Saccharopolyspora gregorii]|uniref:AAA+ ATPase domain-containing protein n=1 Tax=Saccharopolyspora gregorii TaxID=33914 RepID=A0ABP6RQW7_9PSEU